MLGALRNCFGVSAPYSACTTTHPPKAMSLTAAFGESMYARRQQRAVLACLQFLRSSGYELSAEALLMEAVPDVPPAQLVLKDQDLLFSALDALDKVRGERPAPLPSVAANDAKPSASSEVVADTDEAPISQLRDSLDDLHNKANIISVKFDPVDGSRMVTGAVDKTVRVFYWASKNVIASASAPGPILALDVHPKLSGLVLVGCMTGEHVVLDTNKELRSEQVIQSFSDHRKYVVSAKWSPDGRAFATGSHDGTVNIYGLANAGMSGSGTEDDDEKAEESATYIKLKGFSFRDRVEALEWIGSVEAPKLVVSARGDSHLVSIDLATLKVEDRWNMNSLGDDFVSFTCLDLKASADGRYLLAATDSSRTIMLQAGSNKQVRNFYGAKNDEYSNPRICLSGQGSILYSTSQDENSVVGWDLGTEKQLTQLLGHTNTLRGVDHHPTAPLLATCSYDKCVKLWEP